MALGKLTCAAIVAGAMALPMVGASAAVVTNYGNCAADGVFKSDFSFTACAGGYDKNVLANSKDKVDSQIDALNKLGFDTTGFNYGDFAKYDPKKDSMPLMTGETIFGIHFGGGSVLGNVTAFYKFDAGDGMTAIPFATKGLSDLVLYQTGVFNEVPGGVPEPATWAMLIAGFGLVGWSARRRSRASGHKAAA